MEGWNGGNPDLSVSLMTGSCFVVRPELGEDRFIRRIEPLIDETRVVHHILVTIDRDRPRDDRDDFKCIGFPPGDGYVYAWGPGQEAIQFDDGGLRLGPGDAR